MKKPPSLFPHISRFFSATLLWVGLFSLIGVNLYVKAEVATDELQAKYVLGATTQADVTRWKNITTDYPAYRDGYLQLSINLYNLGYIDEAKIAFSQAQTLDPNNPINEKFSRLLEEN